MLAAKEETHSRPIRTFFYSQRSWAFRNILIGIPLWLVYLKFVANEKKQAFFFSPLGIIATIAGLGIFYFISNRKAAARRRIIVYPDRAQLVEGTDTVCGNIPFENVTEFKIFSTQLLGKPIAKLTKSEGNVMVGVVLQHPGQTDTFWPDNEFFRGPEMIKGCDMVLGNHYSERVETIVNFLNAALKRFRRG